MRISLQPAYVLHLRPYRETSVLLDVITAEQGRIALIARGVRNQRSRLKALLQLFVPLLISWQGKSELMTLTAVEANGPATRLKGECLLGGLYLNELLIRVVQKYDPQPRLYTIYHDTLLELTGDKLRQKVLRLFEKKLIEELGYGLSLKFDAFLPDKYYRFHPEHGFEELPANCDLTTVSSFSGKSLQSFAADELEDEQSLRDAKRLMRSALAPLIGERGLQSRKLFLQRDEVKLHG